MAAAAAAASPDDAAATKGKAPADKQERRPRAAAEPPAGPAGKRPRTALPPLDGPDTVNADDAAAAAVAAALAQEGLLPKSLSAATSATSTEDADHDLDLDDDGVVFLATAAPGPDDADNADADATPSTGVIEIRPAGGGRAAGKPSQRGGSRVRGRPAVTLARAAVASRRGGPAPTSSGRRTLHVPEPVPDLDDSEALTVVDGTVAPEALYLCLCCPCA